MILVCVMLGLLGLTYYRARASTICVGEAVTGRAISHGGKGDSAIGSSGDNCFFFANGIIGQQIKKECPIRDKGISGEEGPTCRVEAVISNGVIRRVISARKLEKPQAIRGWEEE
jgi:hypothetical protein